jgi:hypothetical protein
VSFNVTKRALKKLQACDKQFQELVSAISLSLSPSLKLSILRITVEATAAAFKRILNFSFLLSFFNEKCGLSETKEALSIL